MIFEHVLSLNLSFPYTAEKTKVCEDWMIANPDERFVKK